MDRTTQITDALMRELMRMPSELLPHQCEQFSKSLRVYADKLDQCAKDKDATR